MEYEGLLQGKTAFAEFDIIGPIGRGANSFVYHVKHRAEGTNAALKVIDRSKLNTKKRLYRIQTEMSIHKSLDHPNIVKLQKCFQDNLNVYILIEYWDKGELYPLVQTNGKFQVTRIRDIALQLAKGIDYIHSKNIVHRDLKLGNLFLCSNGKLKIGDFGLAIRLEDLHKEEESGPCGTPNYIAPEVLKDNLYTKKLDIWAYGVILYAMAIGNPPFDNQDIGLTLKNIMNKEPEYPKMDTFIQDLIKNCLVKDPEKRFCIKKVMNHPFLAFKQQRPERAGLGLANKLSMFTSQKIKRSGSQQTKEPAASTKQLPEPRINSVKRADSKKTGLFGNSFLKDLSKYSTTKEDKPRLINSKGVKPWTYETKNGQISVLSDGFVELQISKKKRVVRISGDGLIINVKNLIDESNKLYKYEDMPIKYISVYKYAFEVLNLIKSKIPRWRFENKNGRFFLMMNEPYPNFEAFFSNGLVIKTQMSSDKLKLINDGKETIVNIDNGELEDLDKITKSQVSTALKYLEFWLENY